MYCTKIILKVVQAAIVVILVPLKHHVPVQLDQTALSRQRAELLTLVCGLDPTWFKSINAVSKWA